jgi:poly(A) polymerase
VIPAGSIELPPSMAAPETRRVFDALTADGAQARFVGGCVRDALLRRAVKDIDIATDAEPERVMRLLKHARIRAVPTGIDHGTVTAVIAPAHFEITTLRHDVETFGRHARVAFTDDWMTDASRRDFTMNALFCTIDGTLYDPFGGVEDARAGRVRFVGDPIARITEDVLRLLRFFRFQAHYGLTPPEPAALQACIQLAPRLPRLSGERVQGEVFRLLRAADPVPVVRLVLDNGILEHLLPEATAIGRLAFAVGAAPGHDDPVFRLAALLDTDRAGALRVAERLRLSNADSDRLALLTAPPVQVSSLDPRQLLYRFGPDTARDLVLLHDPERRALAAQAAAQWEDPRFPLQGRDLLELGVPRGPQVGRLLKEIGRWWEDRDYRPTREDCLSELHARLAGEP